MTARRNKRPASIINSSVDARGRTKSIPPAVFEGVEEPDTKLARQSRRMRKSTLFSEHDDSAVSSFDTCSSKCVRAEEKGMCVTGS